MAAAVVAVVGIGSASSAAEAQPPFYSVTDLGTGSGLSSHALSINEAGDVVGETNHEYSDTRAFLYSGGVLRELVDLPFINSSALAINDVGQVLVYGWYPHHVIYRDGAFTPLPMWFLSHDINNNGVVAGHYYGHAALVVDGIMQDLGPGSLTAINDGGDVAGFRDVWDEQGYGSVETFARTADGSEFTIPGLFDVQDMNNDGVMVGRTSHDVPTHAARYAPGGIVEDLGAFGGPNGDSSHAFAINSRKDVVGQATCDSYDRPMRAALWTDNQLWDLNDLVAPDGGWSLEGATDINDSGSIVGWGWRNGHRHAVLLTPAAVSPLYNFGGFAPPVDARPALNTVQAGATIPVRFSLGGYHGTDFFAAGYPLSTPVCVAVDAPTDAIEQTSTAGGSSLTYSPATGLYTYAWKTDAAWKNSRRQLVLGLNDGTYYRATFAFR